MAKKLVKDYVFNPGLGIDDNDRPSAYSLIQQNKVFLQTEIVAYIQNQVDASNPDYVGYTYSEEKCIRDSGYVIDALLFDLRYNGNAETRRVSSFYWNEDVPQIDGNRIPEFEAYEFLRDTINTYILTNTLNLTPEQLSATQIIDETKTAEANTSTRVTTLLTDLVSVIEFGLDSLPTLEIGLGRIEVLGKIGLEELLIITNTTSNQVIYNFAEPTKGGTVEFTEGNSANYPQALSVNNGVTVLNFKFNTSSMSSNDSIQVFLESSEIRTRPYDFGTDALERMRVGIPQAMLDADFEYGLQPTKWQAIGTMRGYPSTYEIPASDIPVITVTTDASAGTSGIGASLITVTTSGPHGLEVGQPITIRALASSIIGFNRAEGTFVITNVPTTSSFTYYAKAKVGSADGQVLATTTTQLREAEFYTGASVGIPVFSIQSAGSLGDFDTSLIIPTSSSFIAFEGAIPPTGAPLTGTGIASGTQVTGTFGSGGSVNTVRVKTSVSSGATAIELVDVAGITSNMAIPDDWFDSTTPSQLLITSIGGTTLNLNAPITTNYAGDREEYSNVILNSTNNIAGTATNATFSVTVTAGEYSFISVDTAGSGYILGDTLLITGDLLGGTSPTNDLYLKVEEIGEDSTPGSLSSIVKLSGTGTGSGTFTSLSASQTTNPEASNGSIAIVRDAGVYSFNGAADSGSNIFDGERYLILGTDLGGTSPANDTIITVTVFGGSISSGTMTGEAARGDNFDVYSTVALSQATTTEIPIATTIAYSSITTMEVTFQTNHGLLPGTSIMVAITTDDGINNHSLAGGPFFVDEVPTLNTIRYICRSPGTVDVSTDTVDGQLYIRPDSFFTHRPFDGGVQLGTGGPQHGAQAIRQSKKYIRYQSGKGAMYNTGALFAPSYDLRSITSTGVAVGSIMTIITDDVDHGLQSGSTIRVSGVKTVGYNGEYIVNEIVDERTFRVTASTALGSTTAVIGSQCQISTLTWHGAVVRSGPFDDQNGIFFQYDGQELSVVRRTSTFQVAGSVAISPEKNTLTGTNTRFSQQLQEGDRIVIRGMTHVVTNIASDTSLTVSPDFRGVSEVTGAKCSKVEDLVIPQREWNLDKCDGTGASGYNIDITKMQMIGLQFSWYGAGFIDWMFRGSDGNYVFCHRLKGNNLNTEAYMRTGNLPVRYEVTNEGAKGRLDGGIDDTVSTITLDNTYNFPSSGTFYVDNELISYTGKNDATNQLTGCTRSADLSNFAAGATRTYSAGAASSHNSGQGVVLISSSTSPIISHWGSAYLIDGQFDEDRGYIFSYAETGITVSTTRQTAFLLRLAPSVSNAITGDLGERELLNRAQLLLQGIEVTSDTGTGAIVIQGVLNPVNYPISPELIGWTGLSGLAQGGQPSFAQIASGGSVSWSTGAASTTENITAQSLMNTTAVTNDRTRRVNYLYMRWDGATGMIDKGIAAGDTVSGTSIPSGTTITNISAPYSFGGNLEVRVTLSAFTTGTINAGTTITFARGGNLVDRNFGYFTKASVESANAAINVAIDDATASPSFPAGSVISNLTLKTFGVTQYYEITFSKTYTGTLTAGSSTVTLLFEQPAYAQPGETVFSFIAQPGELAALSLSELKELTNTTIGGRGAFPNGPDVLAINVYRTSGSDIDANIVLRWGEAQA